MTNRRRPITVEQLVVDARSRGGRFLSPVYTPGEKHLWECSEGHEFRMHVQHVRSSGAWCTLCADRRNAIQRSKPREYWKALAEGHGGQLLTDIFGNSQKHHRWRCKQGHEFLMTGNSVQQGKWCKTCQGRDSWTFADACELAEARGGEFLSQKIGKAAARYLWKCEEQHTWYASISNVANRKSWCPTCALKSSQAERVLFLEIQKHFSDAELRKTGLLDKRKRVELDIYIPSLRVGIEYNGEFWHRSAWAISKGASVRDARKREEFRLIGIDILTVWERDWLSNPDGEVDRLITALFTRCGNVSCART